MRKNMVNVLLSIAATETILLSTTACGAKEPETTVIDFSTLDPAGAGESSESAKSMDTAPGPTVGEWITSDQAGTYVQALNTSLSKIGATIEFQADGDALCILFHYAEETLGTDGANLSEEEKEAVEQQLHERYETIKDQLTALRDILLEESNASRVRIIYQTSNGTELFNQEL